MKITIDDVNKTISIEDESVSIANLLKFLKERKIDINEYKLTPTEKVIDYIPYYPQPDKINPYSPEYPPYPWTICDTNSDNTDFEIFN